MRPRDQRRRGQSVPPFVLQARSRRGDRSRRPRRRRLHQALLVQAPERGISQARGRQLARSRVRSAHRGPVQPLRASLHRRRTRGCTCGGLLATSQLSSAATPLGPSESTNDVFRRQCSPAPVGERPNRHPPRHRSRQRRANIVTTVQWDAFKAAPAGADAAALAPATQIART